MKSNILLLSAVLSFYGCASWPSLQESLASCQGDATCETAMIEEFRASEGRSQIANQAMYGYWLKRQHQHIKIEHQESPWNVLMGR